MALDAAADPLALPRSARLVAWGNAALSGRVSLDEAVDRVVAGDLPHRVVGLPAEDGPVGLSLALGRMRAEGVRGLRLALPAAGDPDGLAGPPAFTALAVDAGEAVLTAGLPAYGLVPSGDARTVRWSAYDVTPMASAGTLAEADRELGEAVREATALLAALDVAHWDAPAMTALARLRSDAGDGLAPGYPARAHRVLASARRVAAIAALARRGPGGAVSAGQMALRAEALLPLERAARRGIVAACNAVLEPARGSA